MRERDTRSRRRTPPRRSFRRGYETSETRRSGSNREPERSRVVSPVRRAERDDKQDRSSNIARCGKNAPRSESASMKFLWNNLLDKKQLENVPSSMNNGNPLSGFGYGIGATTPEMRGFSGSGVVPIGAQLNYGHVNVNSGFVSPLKRNEVCLPKFWEKQQQQQQQRHQCQHQQQHVGYGVCVSQPNASSSFGGSVGLSRSVGIAGDESFAKDMNLGDYGRGQQCSVEVMNRDFNHSEMQRSDAREFRHREFRKPSIVDSIVDKIDAVLGSHGDPLRKGAPWEGNVFPQEHLTAKYHDQIQQTQSSMHRIELLGCRDMHPEYDSEGYRDSEGWSLKGYEKESGPSNYQDDLKGLPVLDHDQYYYKLEGISNRMPKTEELAIIHDLEVVKDACPPNYQDGWRGLPVLDHDQYMHKQEGIYNMMSKTDELAIHDFDVEMFELKGSGITNENQIWTDFNTGLPHSHRQCGPDISDDEETSFDEDMMHVQFYELSTSPYSPSPVHAERNSRKLQKIIGKNMKSRPACVTSIPNSLVSSSRNVHARLGPRVVPTENPYHAGKYIKAKNLKRNLYDLSKTSPGSDISDVKVKVKHIKRSKTEPPEDSKAFKQLARNAFFKFVKLLNENPAQRRKYTNQGGTDTLRCTLCGSKSKEFPNTHSLAMHAFNSTKAQCRAEHLGFHKALCVLLGWSDTAASDGLWFPRLLPAVEASNLQNDLIIWPPVVLVHNSSVAHIDLDKRIIVSIERLEAILLGMGFDGGKIKVSRGKPANYSILIVSFNATFSGLREAERLHKFYADNKHGRAELQQIDGSGLKNSDDETQYIPENEESVLYGYLGNAADLDKLDFEGKKHYVVKSKKEIQVIADATLS